MHAATRQEQKVATRERLVNAAMALFARKGIVQTTTADIAKSIRMSHGIVFLHTVEAGPASKSYGIEVARLAGLPGAVIARAREVLKLHERAETQQVREAAVAPAAKLQMTMFTPLSQRIVDRLSEVDVDEMTPREALKPGSPAMSLAIRKESPPMPFKRRSIALAPSAKPKAIAVLLSIRATAARSNGTSRTC